MPGVVPRHLTGSKDGYREWVVVVIRRKSREARAAETSISESPD